MQSGSLVYFSSVSENTHRFVQKLGVPAIRIPLRGRIEVDEPYVLVLPTYGGGRATPSINDGGYVPKQVIAFLNNEHNRSLLRGMNNAGKTPFAGYRPALCRSMQKRQDRGSGDGGSGIRDQGSVARQWKRMTSPAVNSICQSTSALKAIRQVPGPQANAWPFASTKVPNRRVSRRRTMWPAGMSLTPPPAAKPNRISLSPVVP